MRLKIGQETIARVEGKWHWFGARATRECVGPINEVLDLLEEARVLLEPVGRGGVIPIPEAVRFLQKTDVPLPDEPRVTPPHLAKAYGLEKQLGPPFFTRCSRCGEEVYDGDKWHSCHHPPAGAEIPEAARGQVSPDDPTLQGVLFQHADVINALRREVLALKERQASLG